MKKNKILIAIPLTVLMMFVAFVGSASAEGGEPVSDNGVVPIYIAGNPSCTDLGYDFGFKPQVGGSDYNGGYYTFSFPGDSFNTVTVDSGGVYVEWSSTLGIDAVIVKGGPNANNYVYDPPEESFGDSGLASPINPKTGQPYGLSHIEFCYDYEVDVEKTAETTFTRTFEWDIDKSVTPETWNLFTGDSGTSEYTVAVTKTGYTDSDWAVSGTITIENNTPFDATITGVSDVVSPAIDGGAVCGVTFPYVLASGGTLECTYETDLPDGSSRTNTATVTTSGIVGGNSADADVIFGDPTTLINDTIHVSDTNGGYWAFNDSGSVTYERTFTCNADDGIQYNIATIVETGQTDDATVIVNCYDLNVEKDATTTFDRDWDWMIDKSADQTDLMLSPGQLFTVNYQVHVEATSTDSNWAVSGEITPSEMRL